MLGFTPRPTPKQRLARKTSVRRLTRPHRRERFQVEMLEGRRLLAVGIAELPIGAELSVPSGSIQNMVAGQDGSLWFVLNGLGPEGEALIGYTSPSGVGRVLPITVGLSVESSFTTGPDGNLWFTIPYQNLIARVTPTGTLSEFPVSPIPGGGADSDPVEITAGADGNLWFTQTGAIGRITPSGVITQFALPSPDQQAGEIRLAPDGDLWFGTQSEIGLISPSGAITEFALPAPDQQLDGIAVAPNGDLWFIANQNTAGDSGVAGLLSPEGALSVFPLLYFLPIKSLQMTVAADNDLYFTGFESIVAQVTPTGDVTGRGFDLSLGNASGAIATGADGNAWITNTSVSYVSEPDPWTVVRNPSIPNAVMRLNADGSGAAFDLPVPKPGDDDYGPITAGPNGDLYVFNTEFGQHGPLTVEEIIPNDTNPASVVTGVSFSATQGDTITRPLATFTDAEPNAAASDFVAMIDWGDGTTSNGTVATDGNGGFVVSGQYSYPSIGVHDITVTVYDVRLADAAIANPVTDAASVVDMPLPLVGPNLQAYAGTTVGNVSWPLASVRGIVEAWGNYAATIDWGDGTPVTDAVVTVDFDGYDPYFGPPPSPNQVVLIAGVDVYGSHQYASPGTYTVQIALTDANGVSSYATGTVEVDAPPTFTAVSTTASQGELFSGPVATFTYSEPNTGATDFEALIDWGDGDSSYGTIAPDGSGGFVVSGQNVFPDSGPHQVSVLAGVGELVSGRGFPAGVTSTINVVDVPLPLVPDDPRLYAGQSATINIASASNLDVVAGSYSVSIDWGDGTPASSGEAIPVLDPMELGAGSIGAASAAQASDSPIMGGLTIYGNHAYSAAGTFTVHIELTDANGVTSSVTGTVDVIPAPINSAVGDEIRSTAGAPTGPTPVASFSSVQLTNGNEFELLGSSILPSTYSIPTIPSTQFSAMINWGDGTGLTPGTVTYVPASSINAVGGYVVSGSHTYAYEGNYPIQVTIETSGTAAVTVSCTATVAGPPLVLNGGLTPSSDTGISHTDGMTNDNQPEFKGTGNPNSTVRLFASMNGTATPMLIGTGYVLADGSWSVMSNPLADGVYAITASETALDGRTLGPVPVGAGAAGALVIDTAGPQVAGVSVVPRAGQIVITFTDNLSGLDPQSLSTLGTYSLAALNVSGSRRPQIRSASVEPDDRTVVLTLAHALVPGWYELRIRSGGVEDAAGNALDGTFAGSFPSKAGVPGDFVAAFVTGVNRAGPLRPVAGAMSHIVASQSVKRSIPAGPLTEIGRLGAVLKKTALQGKRISAARRLPHV